VIAADGLAAGKLLRRRHLLQQLLAVERLGEEAEYAAFSRAYGIGNRSVRRQDDDRERRVLAVDRLEQLQAVDAGHPQVGDDRRWSLDGDRRQRRFAAVGGTHAIAGRRQP